MAMTALAPAAAAVLRRRDPEFIRRTLPLLWPPLRTWFRPEIRGLERIPADGPVLLVGNHSGGNVAPDTLLLTLAFTRHFGPERPFFQLAHRLVLAAPWLRLLPLYGTVAADPATARAALAAGAAVLVYPGGDWEVHRPVWERNRVDLHGRRGFVRLALETGAPVVPVVSVGGQETAVFLSRGAGLARALRLHRLLRVDVLPIALAAPWGLDVGDVLGHVPLPAKIQIEVLPPVDVAATYGDDVDAAYAGIAELMQGALDRLAARRRLPVLG
jgi:1-acyl-sn-glycerol-3-phosphate acyltransferase